MWRIGCVGWNLYKTLAAPLQKILVVIEDLKYWRKSVSNTSYAKNEGFVTLVKQQGILKILNETYSKRGFMFCCKQIVGSNIFAIIKIQQHGAIYQFCGWRMGCVDLNLYKTIATPLKKIFIVIEYLNIK